jgi:hypothetical protein
MILIALPLITEALKTVNLLLEGVSIDQRRAQSLAWFWMTWPVTRTILSALKVPPEELTKIEELAKGADVSG